MKWDYELLKSEQYRLEQAAFDGGVERYKRSQQNSIEAGEASSTAPNRRLLREFIEPVSAGIDEYMEYYSSRRSGVAKAVQYLRCVPSLNIAYLSVKTIMDNLPKGSSLQQLAIFIGMNIEDQARFTKVEDAAPGYVAKVKETLKRVRSKSLRHKRNVLVSAEAKLSEQKSGPYAVDIDRWVDWPKTDLLHLGIAVIEIIQQTLLFDGEPVFKIQRYSKREPYTIQMSAKVSEWCNEMDEFIGQLSPRYTPCVVPPRDWTSPWSGGYFMPEVSRTLPLVKTSNRKHLRKLSKEQMPEVYKAINTLQRTPWEINTDILEVAQQVQEYDLAIGMPQRDPFTPPQVPVRPELEELRGPDLRAAMTADEWQEFIDWKGEARKVYEAENARTSRYMVTSRALAEARMFSRYPALYFVYTMDSRGRVNCRSGQFGPQGSDLQKALVRFHNPTALGSTGRYWLAIQGANTWGEDKLPFDEREAFIEGMEETIRDIAADPATFRDWADADEPWQFLAWALEWNQLLEWEDSGRDAADFQSKIPVAQDGSCSGIQHYSAMLLDKRGGKAVNLTDTDEPEDIYRTVAEVLEGKLKDAVAGYAVEVNSSQVTLSKEYVSKLSQAWIDTGINRDLCKKAVMTLPYGSTMITCRESVEEYLKDLVETETARAKAAGREENRVHPFGTPELPFKDALAVVVRLLWDSIGEVVVAARYGMQFIQKLTSKVAKKNKAMEWTTPTGFIVLQEIFSTENKRVRTQLMGTSRVVLKEETDDIDSSRMRSSSAPNYVHGLDASHLVFSVNAFKNNGIVNIAVVHDSFGSPAGQVQTMRDCLREEFVAMYQTGWLSLFKDEMEDLIKEEIEEEVPMVGTLDLQDTLKSKYIFA